MPDQVIRIGVEHTDPPFQKRRELFRLDRRTVSKQKMMSNALIVHKLEAALLNDRDHAIQSLHAASCAAMNAIPAIGFPHGNRSGEDGVAAWLSGSREFAA